MHTSLLAAAAAACVTSPAVSAEAPPPVDDSLLEKLPHNHSWRYSPHWATALSCLFFVLFFYQPYWLRVAVWTQVRSLVDDERIFYTAGSFMVHLSVCLVANGGMALIYAAQLPFFEQFKIQQTPWPWMRSDKERDAYFALVRKTLVVVAGNYMLQLVLLWFGYSDAKKLGMEGSLATLPHWYTSLWQISVCMVIEDTLFYWAHRALHHPRVYRYVHKQHHEYKTSIGLASEYAHPLEFLFSNALPFTAGPMLLGIHYWTFWMWMLLRIAETVDGHSGYEFPWSPYRLLPFSGSSTAHDFHHSHNVGNFASFFTWWDYYMGTDQAFLRHERKQAAMRAAQKEAQAKVDIIKAAKKEH